ncbi:flagellar hook-length control protein FliK [Sphingopyxis sp.]|uniref:flagellar hook-length control protein FliK n=1 Tax=Sphingopyxis sp. TaxID=1908224 RepID=UPI002ED969AD
MSASLPMAQPAMPAGFAAFLANIGQVPDGGSEGGGFDQLLAAAPIATAPVAGAAMTIKIDPAQPGEAAAGQIETAPVEADGGEIPAVKTPVKAEPAQADPATLAATLLIALNGGTPASTAVPGKPVPAESEADASPETAAPGDAPASVTATNWAAIVAAAVPAAAKTAKAAETPVAPEADAAPAAPTLPRLREGGAPMPILAGAELPVARPAEAAPSMTILFTQLAPQGTALTEAAAPAVVAERVLDIDSDGAWIDQLARDIAATRSDNGDISFRLMPKHLGRLDVAMQMGDDGVSLKMDTRHEATATIVTAAQGRLVDELRQQGVRVAGAEVTCTPGETGRQSQNQSQGRAASQDTAHLIETATERAEPRGEDRTADRRGRFA